MKTTAHLLDAQACKFFAPKEIQPLLPRFEALLAAAASPSSQSDFWARAESDQTKGRRYDHKTIQGARKGSLSLSMGCAWYARAPLARRATHRNPNRSRPGQIDSETQHTTPYLSNTIDASYL